MIHFGHFSIIILFMKNWKQIFKIVTFFIIGLFFTHCRNASLKNPLPGSDEWKTYIIEFNANDEESVVNYVPNTQSTEWIEKNVPLFECPDKEIERAYYFQVVDLS